jgi:hypothetical protein
MSTCGVTRIAASVKQHPSSKSSSTPLLVDLEPHHHPILSSDPAEPHAPCHIHSTKRILAPIEHRRPPPPERKTQRDRHCSACCLDTHDQDLPTQHRTPNRHRTLAHASILASCEAYLCIVVLAYDRCHASRTDDKCRTLIARLPHSHRGLAHTTPSVFVLAALAWSALAMRQYHVCRDDRFQQGFVMGGLVLGFVASLDNGKLISSRLAFTLTLAMLLSACAHWVCGTVRGSSMEEKVRTRGAEGGKEEWGREGV